ncbi:MAG: lipopolysaccharide biosynthesis protein [Dehalococcoidia bacterium]
MSDQEPSGASEPYRLSTLGRHSLVYGLGFVLSKAVSVIMLPIYTRWLTPTDYGALQLITMTFEFVAIIAGSRLALGLFHFYHKAEDDPGRREVLSTAWLLLAVTYWLAAAATFAVAPWIADFVFEGVGRAPTLIRLAAVSMAFEGLMIVPMALCQLNARSSLFVGIGLAKLALQVACNLVFLIPMRMGVMGVLWGSVTTHAVSGVALSIWLFRSARGRFAMRTALPFLRFGVPLVAMNLAMYVATFGDRYFLNRAGSPADVGLYGLAIQFGFLVGTVVYTPFGLIWDPQRFAVAKRPDRDSIFARVFIYISVPLVSMALGIALFAGDVLRVMATPDFLPAAAFVPAIMAAYVLQSWSFFLNIGTFVSEKTEYYTAANWAAAAVAIAGFFLLIPPFLTWGATVTVLIRMCVLCGLTYWFSQRLFPIQYRWGPIFLLACLAIATGLISALLPDLALVPSIAAHCALFAAYALLLWFLPILSREERGALWAIVSRRLSPLAALSA